MDTPISLITRAKATARAHPLPAFFLLTFLFSWLIWLSLSIFPIQDSIVFRHLIALGAFGPSLTALVLSLLEIEENKSLRWSPVVIAWLAIGLLYLLCLPYASTLPTQAAPSGWIARGLLWTAPALLIGLVLSDHPALRRLLLPAHSSKTSPTWYAAAFLFYPAVLAAGYTIDLAGGGPVQISLTGEALDVALTVFASFIYLTLFGGPLGEESGWRGYTLSRLQARFSPFISTLFIALAWILWRLPLMLNGYFTTDYINLVLGVFLTVFLYTWLYNRTQGNLLVCLIFHAAVTTTTLFLPITTVAIGVLSASSLAVILADKMWLKR